MTIDEIFGKLAAHMVKGMMIHDQMANYYKFLGLSGYAKCHEYHFLEETKGYMKLCRYYVCHFDKLVPEYAIDNPDIIPESWYNYTRQDVDSSTKKSAVKSGLIKWVEWERDTKALYEQMYKELMDLGEIDAASFVQMYVCRVSHELKKAKGYLLTKMTGGFEIAEILAEQKYKHKKYKKYIHCIYKEMKE